MRAKTHTHGPTSTNTRSRAHTHTHTHTRRARARTHTHTHQAIVFPMASATKKAFKLIARQNVVTHIPLRLSRKRNRPPRATARQRPNRRSTNPPFVHVCSFMSITASLTQTRCTTHRLILTARDRWSVALPLRRRVQSTWSNIFFPNSCALLPLFVQIAQMGLILPKWGLILPRIPPPTTVLYSAVTHLILRARNSPKSTPKHPFSFPELESGQNEVPSG